MTTRGCSWIPLATRRLILSWRSPHRTPRSAVPWPTRRRRDMPANATAGSWRRRITPQSAKPSTSPPRRRACRTHRSSTKVVTGAPCGTARESEPPTSPERFTVDTTLERGLPEVSAEERSENPPAAGVLRLRGGPRRRRRALAAGSRPRPERRQSRRAVRRVMWRDAFQPSSGRGAGEPRGVARLVGESGPMRDLKAKIPRVAASPFPVVIEGESGHRQGADRPGAPRGGTSRARRVRAGQPRRRYRRATTRHRGRRRTSGRPGCTRR